MRGSEGEGGEAEGSHLGPGLVWQDGVGESREGDGVRVRWLRNIAGKGASVCRDELQITTELLGRRGGKGAGRREREQRSHQCQRPRVPAALLRP